jgi:hypothetical protein
MRSRALARAGWNMPHALLLLMLLLFGGAAAQKCGVTQIPWPASQCTLPCPTTLDGKGRTVNPCAGESRSPSPPVRQPCVQRARMPCQLIAPPRPGGPRERDFVGPAVSPGSGEGGVREGGRDRGRITLSPSSLAKSPYPHHPQSHHPRVLHPYLAPQRRGLSSGRAPYSCTAAVRLRLLVVCGAGRSGERAGG